MRFALALLPFIAASAGAAPIYRCGTVYTQTPCEGGSVVEATDGRSAAQRAEARRVAAAERVRAAEMARERQANAASETAAAAAPAASEPDPGRTRKGKRKVKTGAVKPLEPFRKGGRR